MGLYLVEPVVAVYAFAGFLMYPLVQQYVYRRLWEELTNSTYPAEDQGSRCGNHSNHSSPHEDVQRAASLFSLYSELFSMIPSLVVTLVLVAYSDHRGRKITIVLPLVGTLVYGVSFLAISFFRLNLYLLIVSNFVSSLFGGLATFLGGCFAYIADLCADGKRRTLRMAGVDMVIGLLSGVSSLCSGYFLRAAGFNWPFLTSVLILSANLLYVVLVLEETVVAPPDPPPAPEDGPSPPRRWPVLRTARSVYGLFATDGRRRNAPLVLLLFTIASYVFANMGGLSSVTLYELKEPLCWNEILIGYGSALSTVVFLSSFVGVTLLSRCLPNHAIVFIGLLSVMAGLVMIAFAETTLMMFLVRIPMLLAIMPAPVLRSMMSEIVSKSEQGALFACVAFLENLSSNVAIAVFSSLYAATVVWFPGFTFLLGAGLCLVPMGLLCAAVFISPDEAKEAEPILSSPEES
ncbi:solute carrier family 46 member 3 [Anguilla anguilla]|uniref:solute carrier family 46 member 3 n=1 Tax=Anguilla anguilla TaxID=7936 RepID=UPI0015AF24C4|nr:solute carrier family 46 member 3 [Anguilla anguilla]